MHKLGRKRKIKMAKNLDLTGFDGKIASEFKKARKTKKGSKGIMEEKNESFIKHLLIKSIIRNENTL